MLDIKLLREGPTKLAANLEDRRVWIFDDLSFEVEGWALLTIERLAALDQTFLGLLREQEEVRRQQNETSSAMKKVGKLPKAEQAAVRGPLIEAGRRLREREQELSESAGIALFARDEAWDRVPNITHDAVPRGIDEHRELSRWGEVRDFAAEGFSGPPRDHLTIAESLDLVDFASGAKVAGQKFYYLKNDAVLLDLALQHFALATARRHGFILHTTPDLARVEILQGLGFNPRGESTQVYSVADSDLCLVGTAEITLGGMFADTILDIERLPLLVAGLSHCFRTEAGSAGQESRGLYRVHQFTKVELFAFTAADDEESGAMHLRMLAIEESIFRALKIPYKVLDIASNDLGGPAYRKFDIEAWMPGRGDYGEVTSTSDCRDYQARRLKIRYRPASEGKGKAKPKYVHMLNGTAIATARALVAILENYQQADGSVLVPEVLRPWVGSDRIAPIQAR